MEHTHQKQPWRYSVTLTPWKRAVISEYEHEAHVYIITLVKHGADYREEFTSSFIISSENVKRDLMDFLTNEYEGGE